jgi:8-oxo-dGTP diphosphatase
MNLFAIEDRTDRYRCVVNAGLWRKESLPKIGIYHCLLVHPSAIRVVAAVIRRQKAALICQRPRHKRHGGLWEFPGGKVEPNETDEAAARRELAEELGVHVESVGEPEFSIADPDSPFLIVFVPTVINGEPTCHEHTALAWLTLTELTTISLAPSDRRYVEFLLAREADAHG